MNKFFIAIYKWNADQIPFYEGLIGMSPVIGIMIGRIFGSVYLNKGRLRSILIGSVLITLGIAV